MRRTALVVLAAFLGCDRTSPVSTEHGRNEEAVEKDRQRMRSEGSSGSSGANPSPSAPLVLPMGSTAGQAGLPAEAGAAGCHPLRGPAPLPRRGPANLLVRGDSIEILQNDDGRPRLTTLEAGSVTASSSSLLREADVGAVVGSAVACARAGNTVFCPDRSGTVRRVTLNDGRDASVANSRVGSRVAAVAFGAHTALAYLASRRTSEGWLSEAWLAVDDDPPTRLSEEGSGATSLAMIPYKDGLLALLVDARSALTALHARIVLRDARTRLGEDVVVFVGGPGDRHSGAEVVFPAGGPGWGLLPIARDFGTFGLAAVRLDEPPRIDEPVVWSMYANGLDPAGLAAVESEGLAWVARIVPRGPEPGAGRVLELGQLDTRGAFAAKGAVPTAENPGDVALAVDSRRAIWVSWVDRKGAWIERLLCR